MSKLSPQQIADFQKKILDFYKKQGRHSLPWRKASCTDYHVAVSELMPQQTQVDRVIPYFQKWVKLFPNWRALAVAPQRYVLQSWQGLGYNSRALRLQELARIVIRDYKGKLPKSREELETLPGIGAYTAGAIFVFAFGQPEIFIETNIRRVFIQEFFSDEESTGEFSKIKKGEKVKKGSGSEAAAPAKSKKSASTTIPDTDILPLIAQTLPSKNIFQWYSALMDYGATLIKTLKKNPNTKSAGYTKQSKFIGSSRQIRGEILRLLLTQKSFTQKVLHTAAQKNLKRDIEIEKFIKVLKSLEKESFVTIKNEKISIK